MSDIDFLGMQGLQISLSCTSSSSSQIVILTDQMLEILSVFVYLV